MSTNKKELIRALEAARDLSKSQPRGARLVQIRGDLDEVVVRSVAQTVWYECRIPSEGNGGWAITQDGVALTRAVRAASDLKTIAGGRQVELPATPSFEPSAKSWISGPALARVAPFMGGLGNVPWQQSVQVYSHGGTLQVTATDGHRAAREREGCGSADGLDVAIPAAMVRIAAKYFDGEILVEHDEFLVRLTCGNQSLVGWAVDWGKPGRRPSVDRAWPNNFRCSALVDAERLARLVRGAGALSEELVDEPLEGNVTLTLEVVGRVVVSAARLPGVLSLPLDAEVSDDESDTAVQSRYLLDALSCVSGKTRIRIAKYENPTLPILEISSGNFACILMPVRVK